MRAWTDRILRFLVGVPTERQTDWRALAGEHCERANDLGASYSGAVAIIDGRDAMIRRLAGELRDLEMLWRAAGKRVAILQADLAELNRQCGQRIEELEDRVAVVESDFERCGRALSGELATAREELQAADRMVRLTEEANQSLIRDVASLSRDLGNALAKRDLCRRAADDLLDVAHQYHGKVVKIAYGLHRPETTDGPDESDICGFCGEPGADKMPHPERWPGEESAGTELVHAGCEQAECRRAHAALTTSEREAVLRTIRNQ